MVMVVNIWWWMMMDHMWIKQECNKFNRAGRLQYYVCPPLLLLALTGGSHSGPHTTLYCQGKAGRDFSIWAAQLRREWGKDERELPRVRICLVVIRERETRVLCFLDWANMGRFSSFWAFDHFAWKLHHWHLGSLNMLLIFLYVVFVALWWCGVALP